MYIHACHGEGDQVGLAGVDAWPLANFSFGVPAFLALFLLPSLFLCGKTLEPSRKSHTGNQGRSFAKLVTQQFIHLL